MRSFLIFVVVAGLGAIYLWQRHAETAAATTTAPNVVVQSKPAPSATVSEHDWMKRSLDRAADVAGKARQQTKEAQDP